MNIITKGLIGLLFLGISSSLIYASKRPISAPGRLQSEGKQEEGALDKIKIRLEQLTSKEGRMLQKSDAGKEFLAQLNNRNYDQAAEKARSLVYNSDDPSKVDPLKVNMGITMWSILVLTKQPTIIEEAVGIADLALADIKAGNLSGPIKESREKVVLNLYKKLTNLAKDQLSQAMQLNEDPSSWIITLVYSGMLNNLTQKTIRPVFDTLYDRAIKILNQEDEDVKWTLLFARLCLNLGNIPELKQKVEALWISLRDKALSLVYSDDPSEINMGISMWSLLVLTEQPTIIKQTEQPTIIKQAVGIADYALKVIKAGGLSESIKESREKLVLNLYENLANLAQNKLSQATQLNEDTFSWITILVNSGMANNLTQKTIRPLFDALYERTINILNRESGLITDEDVKWILPFASLCLDLGMNIPELKQKGETLWIPLMEKRGKDIAAEPCSIRGEKTLRRNIFDACEKSERINETVRKLYPELFKKD